MAKIYSSPAAALHFQVYATNWLISIYEYLFVLKQNPSKLNRYWTLDGRFDWFDESVTGDVYI